MGEEARLLVTRPEAAGRRFLAACEAAWGGPLPAILSPLMAIHPTEARIDHRPAGLLLTSEAGAKRAAALALAGLPAWCVGTRTAAVAQAGGLAVQAIAPDAEFLLAVLLGERPAGPLLHLRGEHARGDLAARLRAAGIEAEELVVYRQPALGLSAEARAALLGRAPLVVPLFSPRSATHLAEAAPGGPRAALHVVAQSPAVAATAAALVPMTLDVAAAPDGAAMLAATLARLRALRGSP